MTDHTKSAGEVEAREAFEGWMASSNYPETAEIALEKLPDGNYRSQLTFAAWQGWQGGARHVLTSAKAEPSKPKLANARREVVGECAKIEERSVAEHTPGPWTEYPMPTKTMAEARANKKLATAAPDLLKALLVMRHMWAGHAEQCEYVVSRYKGRCDCDWPKIAAMSDDAINLATTSGPRRVK